MKCTASKRVRRSATAVGVIVALVAVSACGDDEDDADDATDATEVTEATEDSEADVTTTAGATTTTGAATSTTTGGATTTAGGATTTAAAATTTTVADAPDVDRSEPIRYAVSFSFNSLDPHTTPFAGDALFMRQIYDRLLTFESTPGGGLALVPQLATSYEVADDALSIEWELREGVTFQDGTPFDAEAVKANIERAQGEGSTVLRNVASIESVDVVDDTHVTFNLSKPDPALIWNMGYGSTGMMVSPAAMGTDLTAAPVGAGPFKLVSAQKDAEVVYEAYDGYWNEGQPWTDELVISTFSDPNVRHNSAITGELDVAYEGAPWDSKTAEVEEDGFTGRVLYTPNSYGLLLNSKLAPFDNIEVRRAAYMAIDRELMHETLLNGLQPPSYQPFNKGWVGYDPDLDGDAYDPDAAAALITEAGAEGAEVTLLVENSPPTDQVAVVVQQALTDIGLNVSLTPESATSARVKWNEGGTQGFVGILIGQLHPSQTLNVSYFGPDNPAGPDPELLTMAQAAASAPLDEQDAAYQEIGRWLVENPIHVPIAQFASVQICRPEVVGCESINDIGSVQFHTVGIAAD